MAAVEFIAKRGPPPPPHPQNFMIRRKTLGKFHLLRVFALHLLRTACT